jgi:hypothetical protein
VQLGLVPYYTRARAHVAMFLAESGRVAEGEAMAQAELDAALASGDRFTQGRAVATLATIALLQGDPAEAAWMAGDALTRHDFSADARRDAVVTLIRAHLALDAPDAAVAVAEAALAAGALDPRILLAAADAFAAAGDAARAATILATAAATIEARAAAITDPELRAVFLAAPAQRAIAARLAR